jgi:hypothetical protein
MRCNAGDHAPASRPRIKRHTRSLQRPAAACACGRLPIELGLSPGRAEARTAGKKLTASRAAAALRQARAVPIRGHRAIRGASVVAGATRPGPDGGSVLIATWPRGRRRWGSRGAALPLLRLACGELRLAGCRARTRPRATVIVACAKASIVLSRVYDDRREAPWPCG